MPFQIDAAESHYPCPGTPPPLLSPHRSASLRRLDARRLYPRVRSIAARMLADAEYARPHVKRQRLARPSPSRPRSPHRRHATALRGRKLTPLIIISASEGQTDMLACPGRRNASERSAKPCPHASNLAVARLHSSKQRELVAHTLRFQITKTHMPALVAALPCFACSRPSEPRAPYRACTYM